MILQGKVPIALKFCRAKSALLHEFAGKFTPLIYGVFKLFSALSWSRAYITHQNKEQCRLSPIKSWTQSFRDQSNNKKYLKNLISYFLGINLCKPLFFLKSMQPMFQRFGKQLFCGTVPFKTKFSHQLTFWRGKFMENLIARSQATELIPAFFH